MQSKQILYLHISYLNGNEIIEVKQLKRGGGAVGTGANTSFCP